MTNYIPSKLLNKRFKSLPKSTFFEADIEFYKIIEIMNNEINNEINSLYKAFKDVDVGFSMFLCKLKYTIADEIVSKVIQKTGLKTKQPKYKDYETLYFNVYPLKKLDTLEINCYQIEFNYKQKKFVLIDIIMEFDL